MRPAYLPKTRPSQHPGTIMKKQELLALYGLRGTRFRQASSDGLLATPMIATFAWRVEQLVQEEFR